MTADAPRVRSWWGWGWEDAALAGAELEALATTVAALTGATPEVRRPPAVEDLVLRAPRVTPPGALHELCSQAPHDRAGHAHGKAFRDVARNLLADVQDPPDVVARPRDEDDVIALLEWCSEAGLAAIPYGGGSSVVGGVEPRVGPGFAGTVSIDLGLMDRVLEVDAISQSARIQGGALGPWLEEQLRPHGLTLRHFPQSFEFSTLGGWLATRAGGHFATLYTHIDDLTEALRVVTPAGVVQTRRLPGSGAGPAPDRMFLGSEGALGIITEGWMRLTPRPRWRASCSIRFDNFEAGVAATRAVAQARLYPSNCRLLDGNEAALSAGSPGVGALLVLAFESADHPVGGWLDRALEICRDGGGRPDEPRVSDAGTGAEAAGREGATGAWRQAFMRAPYTRDALARMGMVVETFETACPWDRFGTLHSGVIEAARAATAASCGGTALVTCRFTHVYPDGPAPYFSVIAPGRWGDQVAQWDEIKAAVSEAVLAAGGTTTHHHAVGRDHLPYYERERPPLFGKALEAVKTTLDPSGILNPGVLVARDR
ncbi:MAG: FAD-binding oxidoreductase [Candidatus Dormibacteria bacterium]